MYQESIEITTQPKTLCNISERVRRAVQCSGITTGLCTVFVHHTSASLVIQENADPAVLRDLERWFDDLAPESRDWEHADEGADDMPAHARSVLTRSSESIPVINGMLALGTWQGIYLWEHRAHSHRRRLTLHVAGD